MKITNLFSKIGVTISNLLFAWSIWQHENAIMTYMMPRGMWEIFWHTNGQFFTGIHIMNGVWYDGTLVVQGLCILLLDISFWFWNDSAKSSG
jgi:hypothetical protein